MTENKTQETFKSTIEKQKVQTPLLSIKVRRNLKGCIVSVKSKPFEDFFRENGLETQVRNGDKITDVYAYGNLKESLEKKIGYTDMRLKNRNGYTQAMPLRCKGITNGLDFQMQGIYSKGAIQQYISDMKEVAREIYTSYMKPVEREITISVIEESSS